MRIGASTRTRLRATASVNGVALTRNQMVWETWHVTSAGHASPLLFQQGQFVYARRNSSAAISWPLKSMDAGSARVRPKGRPRIFTPACR